MKKIFEFFQEQDGVFSMTRLTIFMLTLAYICQASWITYQTKTVPDIPMGVVGIMGSLYAMNQELIKVHVSKVFGGQKPTDQGGAKADEA